VVSRRTPNAISPIFFNFVRGVREVGGLHSKGKHTSFRVPKVRHEAVDVIVVMITMNVRIVIAHASVKPICGLKTDTVTVFIATG
jgi:hypothetical protein